MLKKQRWVKSVTKTSADQGTVTVKTKKGALKTYLTHRLLQVATPADSMYCFTAGTRLKAKLLVPLPEYAIVLRTSYFQVQLAKRPKSLFVRFGITPQYHDTLTRMHWNDRYTPCYGVSSGTGSTIAEYRAATTWQERAEIAAIFLQSAIPHYGQPWTATRFAYGLGLVGEEMIDKPKN